MNLLEIKNKVFGKGRPLICVPVMASTKSGILEEFREHVEGKIDIIEWRVDAFDEIYDLDAVRWVLEEVKAITRDTVVLFTFRSKEQGGQISLPQEQINALHQAAAAPKAVDIIDVEYIPSEDIDRSISILHEMGVKVVTSHHDFRVTPSSEAMFMLLEQMSRSQADIVKLAVMPNDMEDVIRLLEETRHFHRKYPNQPLITMSMGKMGCVSRISGEVFGSCVTFGAGKYASAPGQIPIDDLRKILAYMGE